jgi:hypothetical protein
METCEIERQTLHEGGRRSWLKDATDQHSALTRKMMRQVRKV